LAVQVKAAGSGFVYHKYLVSQGELFLHEGQEAGRREPLGRLGRLPIAHPGHPEMIGVPIHSQLELLDTDLRFDGWRRTCFQGMVEYGFHILDLSPVATSNSTHAFFGSLGIIERAHI
jgi:hypothetical protein